MNMSKEGFNQQKEKSMSCGFTEKTIKDLEKEGWERVFSFHSRNTSQWNRACDMVNDLQKIGDWEVILVGGQTEAEEKDGVQYLFKRKTKQRQEWDSGHGY